MGGTSGRTSMSYSYSTLRRSCMAIASFLREQSDMGCNINGCNMNRVFAMRALQTQLSIDFISVELTTERIMVGIAKIEVRRNHLPHSPAAGRLVHRDEIHMALLQLCEH